ncbi:hypothetical protein Q1695_008931 [Nippostrongylus brasiliensis]|nr:hypothetical protein Q1695_008931 [Nippostrongylus brasiliensis]
MYLCIGRAKVQVKKFYENQNDLIDAWKEDEKQLHRSSSIDQAQQAEKEQSVKVWDTRLTIITIILNVALIGAKTTAAVLSDSLAIVASVVDSAMDITSGLVLWYTCRLIERSNKHHYPVGLNRLEPLTTLIVGLIMVFANLLVVEQAVSDTITGDIHPRLDIASLVILLTGTAIKLALFIICRARNTTASRILAIDQRNDCMTNMVALAGAFVGHRWWKYADPIGATCVSTLIIVTWMLTVKEQVPLLIGKSASPQLINRIVNVAIGHDERIKHLDTVYVYHFGANFLVELHVVMDREISLCEAHDVSETLQAKLEQLSFVERAFVHCDYMFDGDEHV